LNNESSESNASDADSGSPAKKGWKERLRPLIGIAILVAVFSYLDLGGSITWTSPDQEEVKISGAVEGDWRSDEIQFKPSEEWVPGELVPPVLVDWKQGDAAVTVLGGEAEDTEGGVYTWTPPVLRVFREIDLRYVALTLFMFFLGNCLVITRWWRLLRGIELHTTWRNVFRLNFLGLFFNTVVPGLTGGDLIKTIIVVRESAGRRTDAFVSVIVDRLLGLIALSTLAAVVVFVVPGFEVLQKAVVFFLVGTFVGAVVYFSKKLRALIHFDALLAKLPMGDKLKLLDDAVMLYSNHKLELGFALLLSITNHFLYITGVYFLGAACGVSTLEVSWPQYLVIVSIANIITAIPTSPGGLGVGEALYVWLFGMIGARGSLGIAVSLTFRLCQMLLGLLGGIFLLLPGAREEIDSARNQ